MVKRNSTRMKTATKLLFNHPPELPPWVGYQAWFMSVTASRLRPYRATRIPYEVISLDEHYVDQVRASGRSVIFTSFHSNYFHITTSWFYHAVHRDGWRIHAVTSGAPEPVLRSYGRTFASVIHVRDLRKAVRALKRGENIVLLQDVPSGDQGAPIHIYDRIVHLRLGAPRLAEMTDSMILPYTGLKFQGRGAMRWWPPIDPRQGDTESRLLTAIATMIHTYPHSWAGLIRFLARPPQTRP